MTVLEHAGSILRRTCGGDIRFLATKTPPSRRDRNRSFEAGAGRSDAGIQLATVRVCGLPVRRLPADQLLYERRNGRFVLQITGHPEFGVPFGQDRLVPIFLATLAVQQKSQVVRFRTAAEMLESSACTRAARSTAGWW